MIVHPVFPAKALTASGLVITGAGSIGGFFLSSGTTVTIQIYDNTTASGTLLLDTTTLPNVGWYQFPAAFSTGCYVVLGGTSPKVSLLVSSGA